MTMFHLKDGLFFGRNPNGVVRIVKTYDGRDIRADNVVMDISTDDSGIASVMASLCVFGETAETYAQALEFLHPHYPGDDEAYRRWRKTNNNAHSPLCSCAGRGDDDAHNDSCPFWRFVLDLRASWRGERAGA